MPGRSVLTQKATRRSVPFMNSREPFRRRVHYLSRTSVVLLLLIAIVTGCASRMVPETKVTITDAQFALPKPSSSQPVMAAMKAEPPEVLAGEAFEISVRVEIASAHHIYASNVLGKPFVPATLDVTLPRGVEAVGKWIGPEPTRRRNGDLVYTDSALFRRPLKVHANAPAGPLSIKGELSYQTCTEELCWPPRTIQLSSSIRVQVSKEVKP